MVAVLRARCCRSSTRLMESALTSSRDLRTHLILWGLMRKYSSSGYVPDLNEAELEEGQCHEIPGSPGLLVQVGSFVELGHFLQQELQSRPTVKFNPRVVRRTGKSAIFEI